MRRPRGGYHTRPAAAVVLGALLAVAGAPAGEGEAAPLAAAGGEPAVAAWERVLAHHVVEGGVRYAALDREPADLATYLESIAETDVAGWSPDRRLAFWINAYNAVVIHRVLERYPGITSVKAVDGFFDERTTRVAGRERTLDEIEAEARKLDPRSHFAVVCASTSCPDLRGEPYRASALDRQLEDQTRRFLADPDKGLRYDAAAKALWLSSIFKWYAGDFTGGSTIVAFFARGGIVDWILPHLPAGLARAIEAADPDVRYLDYDWGLNDRGR
jgi:hypothetical protein